MEVVLAPLLALAMATLHFMGEELDDYLEGHKEQIVSFGAGVSITYIFLSLFPEYLRISTGHNSLLIFPLLGFSGIHIAEKYIDKSSLSRVEASREYGEIHSAFLFIYHGTIGYLLASLISQDAVSGLLFFVPIVMHVTVSSLSLSELHENFHEKSWIKILVSLSPLLGVALQKSSIISMGIFNTIFGVITGMFTYIVIRDSIPRGKRGRPEEYLAGTVLFIGLILLTVGL